MWPQRRQGGRECRPHVCSTTSRAGPLYDSHSRQASPPSLLVHSASSPSSDSSSVPHLNLQTCSAQEYLARTIYPRLAPALQMLEDLRPVDPVEHLALLLCKEADTKRTRVAQLDQIHELREQLRAQYKKEYSVAGRI